MSINTKELQKFYDVWGPMIQSLPAVINAAETATELERHVAVLRSECEAAQSAARSASEQAAAEVASAKADLAKVIAEKAVATREVSEHKEECKRKITEANEKVEAQLAEIQSRTESAQRAFDDIAAALQARKAQADAEYLEHLQKKRLEAEDLEKRIATAEAQLEKLRAKLG